jgi:hypothetical protein
LLDARETQHRCLQQLPTLRGLHSSSSSWAGRQHDRGSSSNSSSSSSASSITAPQQRQQQQLTSTRTQHACAPDADAQAGPHAMDPRLAKIEAVRQQV